MSAKVEKESDEEAIAEQPFLRIGETPVYFSEDWNTGIGGGLWSTGLALAHYFATDHAADSIQRLRRTNRHRLSVLELGSGNGFLSVCLLALARDSLANLVVTDTAEHLAMMQKIIDANSHLMNGATNDVPVHVLEHLWGEFQASPSSSSSPADSSSGSLVDRVLQGNHQFDLIIGSDLAYRKELYDPLIASLLQYSHEKTVALIGVTMADTTPSFFHRLTASGLVYEKFGADLLEPEFRGTTFGVFMIRRRQESMR